MGKVVVLKSVAKPNWAGFKKLPGAKDVVTCPLDQKSQMYKTNLPEDVRARLEKELNVNLSPVGTNPFWNNYKIIFRETDDKVLYLDNPWHELEYYVLLGHKRVAATADELKKRPNIDWYMSDPVAEAEAENAKERTRRKAEAMFDSLSPDQMRDTLILIGRSASNINNSLAEQQLSQWVKNNPEQFLRMQSDKDRALRVTIGKAVEKNIIRKKGKAYFFGEDLIGADEDQAVLFLKDKANAEIRKIIQQSVSSTEVVDDDNRTS